MPASHALAHRTDEKSRKDLARSSPIDPQLFQSQKAILQRGHRGLEQQSQTYNAKSLWIPNLSRYRTRSVSRTGKTTGAKHCPQILLTNQINQLVRREFVKHGLAYGPDPADNYRRAATYVDRILRGAKPGYITFHFR